MPVLSTLVTSMLSPSVPVTLTGMSMCATAFMFFGSVMSIT